MPLMEVYLCRHGATAWSVSGQHTGRSDIPLTDEGRKEARRLKLLLGGETFSAVYSSPVKRAIETALLAGFPDPVLSNSLLEWDYGQYEGKTTAEIRKERPHWNVFDDGVIAGESLEQIERRAKLFLNSLKQHDGKVLLFSSGHISRILGVVWIGLPARAAKHFTLTTASLSILGFEHDYPSLIRWNVPADM